MLRVFLVNDINTLTSPLNGEASLLGVQYINMKSNTIGTENANILNTQIYKKYVANKINQTQKMCIDDNLRNEFIVIPYECGYDACLNHDEYFDDEINWIVFTDDKYGKDKSIENLKAAFDGDTSHKLEVVKLDSGVVSEYIKKYIDEHKDINKISINTKSISEIQQFLSETNFDEIVIDYAYGTTTRLCGNYKCKIDGDNVLHIESMHEQTITPIYNKLRVFKNDHIKMNFAGTISKFSISQKYSTLPIYTKNNVSVIELSTKVCSKTDIGIITRVFDLII